MVPLFGGVPGGPELLILLVVLLLMLAVPLAIAVGLFLLGRWSAGGGSDADTEQLAALRRRVDELEAELGEQHEPGVEGTNGTATDRDADTDAGN